MVTEHFDHRGPCIERLAHDDRQHIEHGFVRKRGQVQEQSCHPMIAGIAAGDGRGLGIEPEQRQNSAPLFVKHRLGFGALDTLTDRLIMRPLRLDAHPPQR